MEVFVQINIILPKNQWTEMTVNQLTLHLRQKDDEKNKIIEISFNLLV